MTHCSVFGLDRWDCKRDASAFLTDLTQQNTGKSNLRTAPGTTR